ncbi:MAG: hypothetical protein ACI3X6_05875 [Alloprevotella sp.]
MKILLCFLCVAMQGGYASAQVETEYSFLCKRSGVIEISPEADSWRYEVGEGIAEELILSYAVGVQFGKKGSDCSYARLTLDKQQSVSSVRVAAKRTTNSTATLQVFVGDVPLGGPQELPTKMDTLTFSAPQPLEGSVSIRFEQDLSKAASSVTHAFYLYSAIIFAGDSKYLPVGATGFATCCKAEAFEMPQGLRGGIVVEDDKAAGHLQIAWLYPAGAVVPPQTPLLLNGAPGSYAFQPVPAEGARPAGNLLRGTLNTAITTSEDNAPCWFYRLTSDEANPAEAVFAWGADGGEAFVNTGGRAYLALPRQRFASASIIRINQMLSGLRNISQNPAAKDKRNLYTPDGRRLTAEPRGRGVYILNGKKIYIR